MSMHDYQHPQIKAVAQAAIKAGFRAFIAERGTYGFYTDELGTKLVSFQPEGTGVSFGGNYRASNARRSGNGWRIIDQGNISTYDLKQYFSAYPPAWAIVHGDTFTFTTLEQHQNMYQSSSKYQEQQPHYQEQK